MSPFALKAKPNVLQQSGGAVGVGDKTPIKNHQTSPSRETNFHPELGGSAVKSQRSTSLHSDSQSTAANATASNERLFEATSPLQQHLLNAPKFVAGHRRNVSDTSAFNK